jgi:hypothetical protein
MSKSKTELIHDLELRLADLANQWRRLHSGGQLEAAQVVAQEYHSTMAKLWALGWDGEGLLPDSELPDSLMPDYYIRRWKSTR